MKIAVILFPGTNCEEETMRACNSVGLNADIVRWNSGNIEDYDGYILPGGFSYEDRVRAGVISAKDPILNIIKKEAKKGKPVLGICNGCQILAESGLIPGLQDKIEIALAPNINNDFSGYYCTWAYIKNSSSIKNAFNLFLGKDEIMPIPIAHGEGRFVTREKGLIDRLMKNNQILFQYCGKDGKITEQSNPNGSMSNIAGICNKEGNVMAMMPHPERCSWMRQLPDAVMSEQPGPGSKIFKSMKRYLEKHD